MEALSVLLVVSQVMPNREKTLGQNCYLNSGVSSVFRVLTEFLN
jgi:hypothetical protein